MLITTAQAGELYARCKSTLGNLWSGTTDNYGHLSLGAPPEDIAATTDDTALISYGVADMCDGARWLGTRAQVSLVVPPRKRDCKGLQLGGISS